MTAEEEKERRQSRGCFWVLAAVALSIGIGTIWGAGYGWLFLGAFFVYALISDQVEHILKSKAAKE